MIKLVKESLLEKKEIQDLEKDPEIERIELELESLEEDDIEISSGLVIIQDNTILLVHPKGAKWYSTYSIPKGNVEKEETLLAAAIRETQEEVSITILADDIIDSKPDFIDYKDKEGHVFKRVYYFIAMPEEKITPEAIIPDKKEIDWAGFVEKNKASQRIFWRFKSILDLLETKEEEEENGTDDEFDDLGF